MTGWCGDSGGRMREWRRQRVRVRVPRGEKRGREWESEEREARLGFLLVDAGEGGPGGAQHGHGGMARQ